MTCLGFIFPKHKKIINEPQSPYWLLKILVTPTLPNYGDSNWLPLEPISRHL